MGYVHVIACSSEYPDRLLVHGRAAAQPLLLALAILAVQASGDGGTTRAGPTTWWWRWPQCIGQQLCQALEAVFAIPVLGSGLRRVHDQVSLLRQARREPAASASALLLAQTGTAQQIKSKLRPRIALVHVLTTGPRRPTVGEYEFTQGDDGAAGNGQAFWLVVHGQSTL